MCLRLESNIQNICSEFSLCYKWIIGFVPEKYKVWNPNNDGGEVIQDRVIESGSVENYYVYANYQIRKYALWVWSYCNENKVFMILCLLLCCFIIHLYTMSQMNYFFLLIWQLWDVSTVSDCHWGIFFW